MNRKNLFNVGGIYRGAYEFYYTCPVESPGVGFDVEPVSQEWDENTGEGLWTFDDPPTTVIGNDLSTYNNQLTYASIPNTITFVHSGFRNLYHELVVEVDFENISRIGDLAFSESIIRNPGRINFYSQNGIRVGNGAFYGCTFPGRNIGIYIEHADTSKIEATAFADTQNITYISLSHDNYNTTDICTVDSSSFRGSDIEEVTIYNKPLEYYTQNEAWKATGLTIN